MQWMYIIVLYTCTTIRLIDLFFSACNISPKQCQSIPVTARATQSKLQELNFKTMQKDYAENKLPRLPVHMDFSIFVIGLANHKQIKACVESRERERESEDTRYYPSPPCVR